jgi:hypothetical protein
MPPSQPGSFVERVFECRTPAGAQPARLRVDAPELDPAVGGRRWRCRLRLTGAGPDVDQYAYGEDGLQALILGLEMARIVLATAPLPAGAALTWLGDADLGIPVMLPGSPVR